jgi:hypothetical protein
LELRNNSENVEQGSASDAESFYGGALDRIRFFMAGVAVALTPLCWWRFGGTSAIGFAAGSVIAYLNFHWLKRVVSALGERATGGKRTSSAGTVFRFLLRYVLMGLGGYAIFKISPASLNGLLAGLFLPAVAIVCEAGYEAYVAVRRGI